MQTEADSTEWLLARYARMSLAANLSIDPFEKSLRAYRTEVHPILKERLGTQLNIGDEVSEITETSAYSFQKGNSGMSGQELLNYVLQPLYDHEEPEFGQIIPIKISTRTVGTWRGRKENMCEYTTYLLEATKKKEGYTDFKELCNLLMPPSEYRDLLEQNFQSTNLHFSIIEFLSRHQFTFPADEHVVVSNRTLQSDLIMNSRFYPSRDDLRAFCLDKNVLRHLSGACLHRLWLPRNMDTRRRLTRNEILPAINKDILCLCLERRVNRVSKLVLVDISNFTGSAANAWLLLYVIAIEFSSNHPNWRKRPNMFAVKGHLVLATWLQLITVYLYYTVGVGVHVPERNSEEFLPGGYLGVNGNITIGLAYLSLVLRNLERTFPVDPFIVSQAGGDDMAILISCSERDLDRVTGRIRNDLTKYVGEPKIFEVIDLDEAPEGILKGYVFCKKRIRLTKTETRYSLDGEPTMPLPACLLRMGFLKDRDRQSEEFRMMHFQLRDWEDKNPYPGCEIHADTIRQFFLKIYRHQRPLVVVRKRFALTNVDWAAYGSYLVTRKACLLANKLETIYLDDIQIYLDTPESRIRLLLSAGTLRIYSFYYLGGNMEVIGTQYDNLSFAVSTNELLDLRPDPILLRSLINRY